jgi:hypothetical protein
MREDEMEALLRLDGAWYQVLKVGGTEYEPVFQAFIHYPDPSKYPNTNPVDKAAFSGTGHSRQEALAIAWQKYQEFAATDAGRKFMQDIDGQMMFRV